MTRQFLLRRHALNCIKAANVVAPKKDVRYYLNCVLLDTRGLQPRIVATDGHRLTHSQLEWDKDIECDDRTPGQYLITKLASEHISKLVKDPFVTLTFDDKMLSVGAVASNAQFQLVDGKFPDFERVIPTTPVVPTSEVGLTAEALSDLSKWYNALDLPKVDNRSPLRVELRDANTTVSFYAQAHLYLVMPVRV